MKIIQHIRNESHRFGVNFHRQKRSKGFIKSELENIPGIGEKLIEKLLTEFKSVDAIKTKTEAELVEVVGKAKAKLVFDYFEKKNLVHHLEQGFLTGGPGTPWGSQTRFRGSQMKIWDCTVSSKIETCSIK